MKAAVIVFPGSNREIDVAGALERSSGQAPVMVWHRDQELPAVDLIVLPGGFAYGDYLRCGAMAARSPVLREIARRAAAGVTVIGICNGFQILCEAGLLPGALLPNASLKFTCRDVHLRVETSSSPFTCRYHAGDVLRVPIANHDGNYFADQATLERLEDGDQVAFRYCSPAGRIDASSNPNGSARNIAGILNDRRNVLGLMPHLENAVDALLVSAGGGSTDGRAMFEGLAGAPA
ncbi:MAG: phosphoribosylformylglycinamidine synthase subunit PurQ [Pseudomonadota bacterium]